MNIAQIVDKFNYNYDRIKDETYAAIAKIPQKALNLDNILTKTLRLRQCLISPEILGESVVSTKFKFLDT